jgi:hypothetical protein
VAGTFTIVGQQRTVQIISATQAVDVQMLAFVTHPSNVYAQRYIPFDAWELLQESAGLGFWLQPIVDAIEDNIAAGRAIGASFVQDIDPVTSLLTDFIEFTVSYNAPGALLPMTTTVRWPIDQITITLTGEIVGLADALDAARAHLQLTAGG